MENGESLKAGIFLKISSFKGSPFLVPHYPILRSPFFVG